MFRIPAIIAKPAEFARIFSPVFTCFVAKKVYRQLLRIPRTVVWLDYCNEGRSEMNRTQLIVLWAGIGILVLMGLFPPGTRGGYDFILEARSVSVGRLCIEWAMVIVVTGGLIYSLKVDPELMLKIPCLFFYLMGKMKLMRETAMSADRRNRSYQEILKDAKKNKNNVIGFWVMVLVFLLLGFIAIRLFSPVLQETFKGGIGE